MKSKILILFIIFSIAFIVLKFYGYKLLGIEKYVYKRESCVEYSNGGGAMITSYDILEFSENEVLYYTENSLHMNNGDKKSFKYSKKNNHIYIKRDKEDYRFGDLDTMRIFGDTLRSLDGTEFIKQ
jgi:hypothetical protein